MQHDQKKILLTNGTAIAPQFTISTQFEINIFGFFATFTNHNRKTKHAKIRVTLILVHIASFQENLHWNRE